MNRLTFQTLNGDIGVVGMSESNAGDKVYACVAKLAAYEDTGRTPEECAAPNLCVGAVLPNRCVVDSNFCNLYILASRNAVAWNPGDPMKEYAVFHLDGRREPYSGKYCKNAEEAQRYFAWLCFDWFNDKDRPDPALGWKNYGTHRIARYKKWLLLIDCMRDVEDIIYLLRPDADWDNECLVCEYEEITAYEPEWEVGSEREAVDYIDNCEENKASKKGGGSALRHGASREDVAMAMEAVKGDANAAD